jgi:hypothetical protein
MAAISLWTNPLAASLPGAIPAQVEEKLRHTVKEFFLQSRSWRKVLGPFDVTIAVPAVVLTPPADSQVVWVRGVWLQEGSIRTDLAPVTSKITEARSDRPTHYYFDPPTGTVQLWPTPDATLVGVLYAEVALTPTTAAATFPDLAETHHFEAIQEGALSRLMAMPNKPWSDPMMAARYGQLFRRRCLELRAVSDAGYTHSDPPWRFPNFA